jgi:transposase InsO family protein
MDVFHFLPLKIFQKLHDIYSPLTNNANHTKKGKSVKASSPQQEPSIRSTRPLQLLHSDICRPMRTTGIDKSLYMITLVDDYSWMTLVRGLAQKSNTGKELLAMIAIMEKKGEAKVEMIQTDNGGEYRSTELLEELKKKGITIKETVPYHSQINPVAERTNRTIITMGRTALLQNSNSNTIPRYLWTEAIQHSAYTKNRTPHRTLGGKSPIEVFNNKASATILEECKAFRVFGKPVYAHQP